MTLGDQAISGSATELGLSIDPEQIRSVVESRSLTQRFVPWLVKENLELPLVQDQEKAELFIGQIESKEFKKPMNASFSIKDDELVINNHVEGVGVDSESALNEAKLLLGQDLSDKSIDLKTSALQPDILKTDIEASSDEIKERLTKQYSYNVDDKTTTLTKAQLAQLIELQKVNDAVVVAVNQDNVKKLIDEIASGFAIKQVNQVTNKYLSGRANEVAVAGVNGRKVVNAGSLAEELAAKLQENQSHQLAFEFEQIKFEETIAEVDDVTVLATYTYNVEVWGAVASDLAGFKSSAAATLASANGWAGAGISFGEVASGGSFTLVLASPERVAAASSGCSAEYSCRVGRYVIINDQRWQGATPAWNAAGGGLRDYRHMVVNHEVGHWLGFDHRACTGAGQPAPVMLQQSIDLGGCKFNPWPTAAELGSL